MVPKCANGMQMETQIAQARSENFEGERRHALHRHAVAVRLMAYVNHAHRGSYRETIDRPAFGMDITKSRAYRAKYGAGINQEQEIAKDLGVFFRYGWNDGHTETWAFAEIDRTGKRWSEPSRQPLEQARGSLRAGVCRERPVTRSRRAPDLKARVSSAEMEY